MTVAEKCDSLTFLRQCGQGFSLIVRRIIKCVPLANVAIIVIVVITASLLGNDNVFMLSVPISECCYMYIGQASVAFAQYIYAVCINCLTGAVLALLTRLQGLFV